MIYSDKSISEIAYDTDSHRHPISQNVSKSILMKAQLNI